MEARLAEHRPDDREAPEARSFWCGDCGYGVVVRRDPPLCPMCRGANWLDRPSLPRRN